MGGRGLSNGPSFRRSGGSRPVSSTNLLDGGGGGAGSSNHLPHTMITVYSDEKGYGMKVSGDNPVYVQSVKEGKLFCYAFVLIYLGLIPKNYLS